MKEKISNIKTNLMKITKSKENQRTKMKQNKSNATQHQQGGVGWWSCGVPIPLRLLLHPHLHFHPPWRTTSPGVVHPHPWPSVQSTPIRGSTHRSAELSSMDTHQEFNTCTYPVDTRQGFYIVLVPEDFQSICMGSTTFYPSAVFVHGEYYAVSIVGSHLLGALHHISQWLHPRGVIRDVR